MFQSTHPRRVRLYRIFNRIKAACFNPRTHVGCDCYCGREQTKEESFNPRTHVGCDVLVFLLHQRYKVSIHAPT